jgi:phage gp46-like protein
MARGIDATLEELPGGVFDIEIGFDGDIQTEDSFDTYIKVALFTDRRANEAEVREPERRRGWVGNEHTPGFEMGSKLWLFEQPRLTKTVLNGLEQAAIDALQSMVEENLAVSVRKVSTAVGVDSLTLELEILRDLSQVEKRYFDLWQNTGDS